MAKTRVQKSEMFRDLELKLDGAKSVVFARFDGMGAADSREFKRKLKSEASECYVAKKTLLAKALKSKGMPEFDAKSINGQLAVIFGYGDEVTPAKVTNEFIKSTEGKLEFAGGILEGKLLSKIEVDALAKLPSKQELYARLVGSMNAPVSGFANVLAGNLRGFVRVLSAVAEKKSA